MRSLQYHRISVSTDDSVEVEIELTADLSVPSTPRSDSTVDERVARLELELFEQSEKMTLVNRNLLRNQLALQDSVAQIRCSKQNATDCQSNCCLVVPMRY